MSVADEVLCNSPLFGKHRGEVHLIHGLGTAFAGDSYEITGRGRLELLLCTYEDRSDHNAEGWAWFARYLPPVFTGERRDLDYHGWLALPGFGRVKFTDGSLVQFLLEAHRAGDVAHEKKLIMTEIVVETPTLIDRYTATDDSLMSVGQEPSIDKSEDRTSTILGSTLSASMRSRGALLACAVAEGCAGPFREVTVPMTVRINVPDGLPALQGRSSSIGSVSATDGASLAEGYSQLRTNDEHIRVKNNGLGQWTILAPL